MYFWQLLGGKTVFVREYLRRRFGKQELSGPFGGRLFASLAYNSQ
jgi:hypothetical protein